MAIFNHVKTPSTSTQVDNFTLLLASPSEGQKQSSFNLLHRQPFLTASVLHHRHRPHQPHCVLLILLVGRVGHDVVLRPQPRDVAHSGDVRPRVVLAWRRPPSDDFSHRIDVVPVVVRFQQSERRAVSPRIVQKDAEPSVLSHLALPRASIRVADVQWIVVPQPPRQLPTPFHPAPPSFPFSGSRKSTAILSAAKEWSQFVFCSSLNLLSFFKN